MYSCCFLMQFLNLILIDGDGNRYLVCHATYIQSTTVMQEKLFGKCFYYKFNGHGKPFLLQIYWSWEDVSSLQVYQSSKVVFYWSWKVIFDCNFG